MELRSLIQEQFIGNNISEWSTVSNWRGIANSTDIVQLGADLGALLYNVNKTFSLQSTIETLTNVKAGNHIGVKVSSDLKVANYLIVIYNGTSYSTLLKINAGDTSLHILDIPSNVTSVYLQSDAIVDPENVNYIIYSGQKSRHC